jgi:hypothetical protein
MVWCRDGNAVAITCGKARGARFGCTPTGLHIKFRDSADYTSPIRRVCGYLGVGRENRIPPPIDQCIVM